MHGLGLGVMGSVLVGCGADGSSNFGSAAGGTGGAGPIQNSAPTTGAVNLSQFGGGPLKLVTAAGSTPVGADGNATVQTSTSGAQVLFATDASNNLRGLTLKIPGQPLTVDARSTALALVFLVPGVATLDPTVAAARATRLQAAPSFAQLVAQLTAQLPNNPLPAILPNLQTLIAAAVEETVGTPQVAPKVFTAAQAATAKPGGYYVTAGVDLSPANGSFDLNNSSFRYASVVRQFFTTRGTSAQALRTNLVGAPFARAVSVMSAASGLGLGNLVTGQLLGSSSARDNFSLLEHNPALEHVVYYIRGLGWAGHRDQATLPQEVSANLFEDTADVATLLLSFLYPLVEMVLGVSLAAGRSVEALLDLVGQTSAGVAATNAVNSANTGQAANLASALLDAFHSLINTPQFADALFVLFGEGVTAAFEAAMLYLGLALGIANFLITAKDVVTKPRLVAIEVPVPVVAFSDELGAAPDFNSFLDVNAQGAVIYQNLEGTAFRKKPFAAAQSLGGPIPFADQSQENGLTTYADSSGQAFLRNEEGTTGTVPLPSGMSLSSASSNPQIDPKGEAVAVGGIRTQGSIPDIYLYERNTQQSTSLQTSTARAEGLFLGGLNATTVFARGAIGGTTSQLARWDRTNRSWSVRQISAAPLSNYRPEIRGVNKHDEALIRDYREDDDNINPVSSVESIVVETRTGLETVFTGGVPGSAAGVRPDPLAINDEGEILAVLYRISADRQNNTEETVLFQRRGGNVQVALSSLLPRGMPAGPYRGIGMGGRYVVARRLANDTHYLIFLGRSVDDVKNQLGVVT